MTLFRFSHRLSSLFVASVLTCLASGCAESEPEPPATPPPPPPAPSAEPATTPEPYTQGSPGTPQPPPAPPPAASAQPETDANGQLVYTYPTGQWVYASGHGWMWVPNGATTTDDEGVPYVYLYTPAYGWTWYVSPWGPGVYRYGLWVHHPWHPVGWHGYWVAHPRVVGHFRGGGGFRR